MNWLKRLKTLRPARLYCKLRGIPVRPLPPLLEHVNSYCYMTPPIELAMKQAAMLKDLDKWMRLYFRVHNTDVEQDETRRHDCAVAAE